MSSASPAAEGATDLPRLPEAVDRVLGEPEFGKQARAFAREIAALPSARDAIAVLGELASAGPKLKV